MGRDELDIMCQHLSGICWRLTGHFTVSHDNIITQQSGKLETEREDIILWDGRMTADEDEKWDNGQFNLDKLWDPPPSLHIWDTCDARTRAPGERGDSFRSKETFSSEPEPTQEGLAFLGNSFSDLSRVLTPATDHRQQSRPAGPGAQTGNLNRPLIVLTSSSWINIVTL